MKKLLLTLSILLLTKVATTHAALRRLPTFEDRLQKIRRLHMLNEFLQQNGFPIIVNGDMSAIHARNATGETPLHRAASLHFTDFTVLLELLKRGADVNARDIGGGTPLHMATYYGRTTIIRLLLMYGADINAETNGHITPLSEAVLATSVFSPNNDLLDCIRLLVAHGANTSSALHTAVKWDIKSVELLLELGADVNGRDDCGNTPLHEAAFWGHLALARLLIENGADIHAQTASRDTPLLLARDPQIKALIRAAAQKHTPMQ